MKKLLLCTVMSVVSLGAVMIESPFSSLLLEGGKANDRLKKMCAATNVSLKDDSLESVVNATQEGWLRAPATGAYKERWEVEDRNGKYKEALNPFLKELGLLDPILPSKKSYDYGIILGATVKTVDDRFQWLHKQIENGLNITSLVLLGGDRDLTDGEKAQMKDHGSTDALTETDAMKFLAHDFKRFPRFNDITIVTVHAEKQKHTDGSMRRPNTGDTIDAWMAKKPKPGSILAVSSQPFTPYQDSVLRTYLPNSFSLETVGDSDGRERTATLYLDTIARWLYSEKNRLNILKNEQ